MILITVGIHMQKMNRLSISSVRNGRKTGGHKYITPGAHEGTAIKYIDTRIIKSKRLPDPNNRHWGTLGNYQIKDFDYSWHHDETDEPFVYQFGNKYYSAEEMPTDTESRQRVK